MYEDDSQQQNEFWVSAKQEKEASHQPCPVQVVEKEGRSFELGRPSAGLGDGAEQVANILVFNINMIFSSPFVIVKIINDNSDSDS